MSPKSRHATIVLSLLFVVILSLGLVLFYPFEKGVSAEDIQHCLDSLGNENLDDPSLMRERAYELATVLFDDSAECDRFANEVTAIYFASKNVDFLLVYNTGGFGGAAMADDPEWPSILEGIRAELADLGYESMIIEHQRGKGGIGGFIEEVEELEDDYLTKAPELAAKVAFLTKYNPELKVITTGRCFGAIFSNEVMELEAENLRVYSIQAGVPFWYTEPGGERTLVLEDNGEMPDILGKRGLLVFLWALGKANFGQRPSSSPIEGGSIKILSWYFRTPGHTYAWNYPGVRSRIVAFLEENFANEGV
jgi:hypothetical protein